jgi:hypothetical protein
MLRSTRRSRHRQPGEKGDPSATGDVGARVSEELARRAPWRRLAFAIIVAA